MRRLLVGIDAGGTHTTGALAENDELLRTFDGEGANPNVLGAERAADAVAAVVASLLDGAQPAAIGVGVAGAGDPAIRDALRDRLSRRFPGARISVTSDARIALRATLPEGDGLAVIAGTGAIAYAEIGDRTLRAGGYGYLLGDDGSGFAIGSAAVRELVDAGNRELLARVYASATPVAEIASYAPQILRRAADGDGDAHRIVQRAANCLFEFARAIAVRCGSESLATVLSGGLMHEESLLRKLLRRRIVEELPMLSLVEPSKEPFYGALAEARDLLETT